MTRYWNADMEQLDRKSIKELQNRKLRAAIRSLRHHPFYSQTFSSQGIDPADILEVDDLRKLPFTVQQDMAKSPEAFVVSPSQKAADGTLTSLRSSKSCAGEAPCARGLPGTTGIKILTRTDRGWTSGTRIILHSSP
jgi:hypothetical protein